MSVQILDPATDPATPPAGTPDPNAWDIASLPEGAQKYIKELRAEAASYRVSLTEVNEKLSKAKTPEDFAAATESAKKSQRELLVELVATKNNIPDALRDRLRGETREELEADAKVLATAFSLPPAAADPGDPSPPAKPVIPNPNPNDLSGGLNPSPSTKTEKYDPAALAAEALKARGGYVL